MFQSRIFCFNSMDLPLVLRLRFSRKFFMQWRNTSSRYGVFSLFLHWGSALVVFGLFGLGLWMRELSYYDPWYHPAPALHKSIGILLAIALLVRIVWRFVSPPPPAPANHGPLTRVASKLGHLALYGLLLAVIVAGYLISTADGEPISVFGWFSVPATLSGLPDQADVAGEIHLYLAWALVVFAVLHALAALKHHFVDRDPTLKRMLGRSSNDQQPR
ncbi:Nickel-dependent hydrogenase B-type cytochrome subunit [Pseudomonas aeruginosa]|nr:Nickel-dependent hydrogenase B-type cytochrome subunit [Pseudomonas aeruginosa]